MNYYEISQRIRKFRKAHQLSKEELDYLLKTNPIMYAHAMRIQRMAEATEERLKHAKSKEEADQIILLLFNRFSCLYRAFRRYCKYANKSRPDMAEGCNEKYDIAFMEYFKKIRYISR